jgi:uncharacterized Tic20 family protein
MMNERIPLKIRLIAAGIHATNTIVNLFSGLLVLSYILEFIKIPAYPGLGTTEISSIGDKPETWQVPVPLFFGLITVFILWRITKKIHPFVSRSGRYATNHALNCLVMPFFVFALFSSIWYTSCGIKPLDGLDYFIFVPVCIVYGLVSIAYFLNSIIAGIFTLRGYDFNSGLIIPFIRSE